jgi:pentatricopeptide repeat protein
MAAMALQLLCRPSLSRAQLRQVHAVLVTSSALADRFLPNKLLRSLLPAHPLGVLRAFRRLRRLVPAFRPNAYTFSFLLTAAAASCDARLVPSLHALALVLSCCGGGDPQGYVSNGLIHSYASRGGLLLCSARRLFDEALSSGRTDVCSWTALLTAYARDGQVDRARALFDGMPRRNGVSWSAMLSAYVAAGGFAEALQLFQEMLSCGVRPNRAAVVGALASCGALGALEQGRWLHAYTRGTRDAVVATALVDMYAKCGSLDAALQVFDDAATKDVFTYTAMISGLSDHGRCQDAIRLFHQMQQGVRPNEVTFICVLTACARAGLVQRARDIFRTMASLHGIQPGVKHYACLVDVLGRAGMLEEALDLVRAMPMRPDYYVLGALLNACTAHGHLELGRQVVAWLAELGLDHSGVHVQLSNMYAGSSNWDDVLKVRTAMDAKDVLKLPGCSMVQVNGEFAPSDRAHPYMEYAGDHCHRHRTQRPP